MGCGVGDPPNAKTSLKKKKKKNKTFLFIVAKPTFRILKLNIGSKIARLDNIHTVLDVLRNVSVIKAANFLYLDFP